MRFSGVDVSAGASFDLYIGDTGYQFIHPEWMRPPEPEWVADVARIAPNDAPVFFVLDYEGGLVVVLESGTLLKRTGEAWHCISHGPIAVIGADPRLGVSEGLGLRPLIQQLVDALYLRGGDPPPCQPDLVEEALAVAKVAGFEPSV